MKREIVNFDSYSNQELPAYLLNIPFSFDTKERNNVWMQNSNPEDLEVNKDLMFNQWLDLYSYLSSEALVQLLPTPKGCTLQDLVFVANMGIVLNHIKDRDIVIISNFTSEPRIGEEKLGIDFFNFMGYETIQCPYKFEGEADLKHIRDNIYIGGYGIRSDIKAYEWMEENFDMKIIKVKMNDQKLYHLDCSIFPITPDICLVATKVFEDYEVEEIKKYCEVIHIPTEYAYCGLTNSVRIFNVIINSSDIYDLDPQLDKEDYKLENGKNRFLEDICMELGLELMTINLSEFMKGGALLSCLVMHLNRNSYNVETI